MIFTHDCTGCGHPRKYHDTSSSHTRCTCCRKEGGPTFTPGPTVRRDTYLLSGETEATIYPPGSTRNAGTVHRETLCDCPGCQSAYAEIDA